MKKINVAIYIIIANVLLSISGYIFANGEEFPTSGGRVILPGFNPIVLDDRSIKLGASRHYRWGKELFPSEFLIKDKKVAGPVTLELVIDGQRVDLASSEFRVIAQARDAVDIQTKANYKNKLGFTVRTRIEYDGVAMVEVVLDPLDEITVDSLTVRMPVVRNQYTTMLAYNADTVRSRIKQIVYPLAYRGDFLNAVGFPNGENSFWFFADNAEGWIWNGENVTEVSAANDEVVLNQHLIGGKWKIDRQMVFKFNYLLTPVKEMNPDSRQNRIARRVTKEEGKYAGTQLWWTTAFAHIDYPYTKLDKEVVSLVPKNDIAVYPGLSRNIKNLRKWRKTGIERIPYFSAHVLSTIDPELQKNRTIWEVEPPFVMRAKSDGPFTAKLAKPWLSHRGAGYSDYLIDRFDKLIDELGIEGVYFDQAGVIQSKNPAHGLWIDSNGKEQASLDMLGLRDFFKRLATLFYVKEKDGIIAVHNSMSAIVPAYTFVESMVQGEEYTRTLQNLDYIDTTPLVEARSKFSGDQYGISVAWLSELWTSRVKNGRRASESLDLWTASEKYLSAYDNFSALALLHGSRVFSVAPLALRSKINHAFDRFDVENSELRGYWLNFIDWPEHIRVTYYRHKNNNRYLVVLVNLKESSKKVDFDWVKKVLGVSSDERLYYRDVNGKDFQRVDLKHDSIKVLSKSYRLFEIFAEKPFIEKLHD